MHRKGSRCGIVTRAWFGPRASTIASVALLGLLVSALPAAGSHAPDAVAGSVTVVIHGQGRVTSEPPGAIDCPAAARSRSQAHDVDISRGTGDRIRGRALASCTEVDVCTVQLNDFAYTIDVYFRPRAKLQLWPNGNGTINVTPPPADWRGEPTPRVLHSRELLRRHGLRVLLPARSPGERNGEPRPGEHVLWFSTPVCSKTAFCTVNLVRDTHWSHASRRSRCA